MIATETRFLGEPVEYWIELRNKVAGAPSELKAGLGITVRRGQVIILKDYG